MNRILVIALLWVASVASAATVKSNQITPTIQDTSEENRVFGEKLIQAFELSKSSSAKLADALKMNFDTEGKRRRMLLSSARREAETANDLISEKSTLLEIPEVKDVVERIQDNSIVVTCFWHADEMLWLPMSKQGLAEANSRIQSAKALIQKIKNERMRKMLERDFEQKEAIINTLRKNLR